MTLMLLIPPLSGVECDLVMEVEFEFCEGAHSDGVCLRLLFIWTSPFGDSSC